MPKSKHNRFNKMPRTRQPQPKPDEPKEDSRPAQEKEVTYVRAHEEDGTFAADDPATPENEAWDPPKPPQIHSRPVTRDKVAPKVGSPKRAEKTVTSPGFGTTKVYSVSPTT